MGICTSDRARVVRRATRRLAVLAAAICLLVLAGTAAHAVTLPTSFVEENAVPGHAFYNPTGIAFLPDGRFLVAEKRGLVWMVANGVAANTPSIDLQSEVLDLYDRGLLDVAVDPNFNTNRYIYLLYTVDPNPSGPDTSIAAFGRLTRYTLDANNNAIAASRTILVGDTWTNGFLIGNPSHSVGALRWGADGSLLVSCGDGALYTETDPGGFYPYAFGTGRSDPYEDIGAFRAQSVSSLCGKVLRINPATGAGYSNNPFYDGNLTSKRSRIWVMGLRNPFRFTVRPGTGTASTPGTLYIGDVGYTTWEETNVAPSGGYNFGWPCYEGRYSLGPYQAASPAHNGCGSFGTTDNPSQPTLPAIAWNHSDPNVGFPPGFSGNCSIGGSFYTGSLYPSAYQGRYFFTDYGQNWLRVATFDANDQLVTQQDFGTSMDAPVDVQTDPLNGDLHYVSITTGEVRRIRYTGTGGNAAPVAVANANPDVGSPPLNVQFSSSGSFDPDNDPIGFGWNFGDGTTSTAANPTHTFATTGIFFVTLSVQDSHGAVGLDTVQIVVAAPGNFPTTAVLDGFNRANGAIGSNWIGTTTGLTIANNQLAQTGGAATPIWSPGVFGSTQEAYVTLNAVTGGATEHDLMLKIQGATWDAGHIEVRYDVDPKTVTVSTYDPGQGWVRRGGPFTITFNSGDRMGARAYPNGLVEVYKNSTLIGSASVSGWPGAGNGGRIGMSLVQDTQSLFDNFGGGDAVLNSNTKPHATISSPAPNSFFIAGQTISLAGSATDSQDIPDSLKLRWEVDIHHNNHIHPDVIALTGATASFPAVNHDDGTGWYYVLRLIATDTGGLADTATENIYPEIDVHPSAIAVSPASLTDGTPAQVSFSLQELGRMPAPIFHWQLTLDNTTIAQGDTLIPASSSVSIVRGFTPFPGGAHTLRAVADTTNQLVETNESNNASVLAIVVADGTPPTFVTGPTATPGSTSATIAWTTNESATGAIRFGPTPSLGDSVTVGASLSQSKAITGLSRSTLYYYQVAATDGSGNTRLSALSNVTTLANRPPTAVAGAAPTSGGAPLFVQFSSTGSSDPDGDPLTYAWTFGDGQTSTAASPSHTYAATGAYTAQLTVSDGAGGSGSASVGISVTSFPSTAVLDNFNRTSGAVGGSWTGQTTGLAISNNQLVQTVSGWNTIVWNGASFGADQEAYVTLAAITATAPEHDVLLKMQGTTPSSPQIEVRYDRTVNQIKVSALATAWTTYGSIAQTFVAGDQLGARASSAGVVDVFRNGTKIGSVSVAAWPYATLGGRVGLTLGQATASALDNYGGGSVATGPDVTPPTFTSGPTATPALNSAQVAWTTNEAATGAVRYGPTSALGDSVLTPLGTSGAATIPNLTRGTTYSYRVAATDAAGNTALSAITPFTTTANHPPVAAASGTPNSGGVPLTVQFSSAGSSDPDGDALGTSWSFGDGSAVNTTANPSHTYTTAGGYTAQLTVSDGFGGSNSKTVSITVNPPDVTPPTFLSGPSVTPSSSSALVQWTTDESARGAVRYGPTSSLGDSVLSGFATAGSATIPGLTRGTTYFYRVAATDASNNTRLSAVTSFATLSNGVPTAVITATPASGPAPLTVAFSSASSTDPDNDPLTVTWNFGDGSATSTTANPSHTYASAGAYTVQLTVNDGFGGSNSTTATITASGVYFPVTGVLDDFNRASGSVGGSWVAATTLGLAITSQQQLSPTTTSGVSPVWDGAVFGTSQEAFVTLATVPTASTEIDLMLKVQGTIWSAGHIEVRYDNTKKHIVVSTYASSQGWRSYATINVTMSAGDQLGARAYSNGMVEVLRNGARLGTMSVTAWPSYALTGRIGMTLAGSSVTRVDNFGGGTITANRAPVVVASGVPTSGAAPLTVSFSSAGTHDADGNPLTYAWTFGDGGTSTAASPSHAYVTTGAFTARLTVSDGLGGSASATVPVTVGSASLFSDNPVLDDFARVDGAIGASWSGETDHVAISGQTLVLTASEASIVYLGGPYPATQEAFVRLSGLGPDVSERDLMLKVQGTTWDAGHVEVRYAPALGQVVVSSYTPGTGWVQHGTVPAAFVAGDELGAAIDPSGNVDVFQNQAPLGRVTATGWPYVANGGRVGVTFAGDPASPIDDFGGGAEGQALSLDSRPPIQESISTPALMLSPAFPNPSHGDVSWSLTLPVAGTARWEIVDLMGRAVWREQRDLPAGTTRLDWRPAAPAPPGVYLAVARVGGRTLSRRFVLLAR